MLKLQDMFVITFQYPEKIRNYDYDPMFAIRGLHIDIEKVMTHTHTID